MAKSSVISFVLIVFLFVVGKIERVSSQYVSDEDLMADPTKCGVTDNNHRFQLQDIACQSNGISELIVFGHTDNNLIYLALENVEIGKFYSLYIERNAASIISHSSEILNMTRYNENILNMTDFIRIEIQLNFGYELLMQILLPNGVKIFAVDTTPISINTVWFYYGNNWYVKCPPSKVRGTESVIPASTTSAGTEESSSESTFDPHINPETFQPDVDQSSADMTEFDENREIESSKLESSALEVQQNEANSISGHFWVQSKAKTSNFFGFFNLTLS